MIAASAATKVASQKHKIFNSVENTCMLLGKDKKNVKSFSFLRTIVRLLNLF